MTDNEVSFLYNIFPCDCKSSSYGDPHHKHLVTLVTLGSSLTINFENYFQKVQIIE